MRLCHPTDCLALRYSSFWILYSFYILDHFYRIISSLFVSAFFEKGSKKAKLMTCAKICSFLIVNLYLSFFFCFLFWSYAKILVFISLVWFCPFMPLWPSRGPLTAQRPQNRHFREGVPKGFELGDKVCWPKKVCISLKISFLALFSQIDPY